MPLPRNRPTDAGGAGDEPGLLLIAAAAIDHGLAHGAPPPLRLETCPVAWSRPAASFVTLLYGRRLRGCIGSLTPQRPLALDVSMNAYAAAFRDPRFPALSAAELAQLTLEVAVLDAPETVPCASEAELLAQLRPHVDGLIVEEGTRRATFLPKVWEVLPRPGDFLRELRLKAGLPADHWSATLRFSRYTTRVTQGPYVAIRAGMATEPPHRQ
jgi:AmmeMemoRadiSam system protein A